MKLCFVFFFLAGHCRCAIAGHVHPDRQPDGTAVFSHRHLAPERQGVDRRWLLLWERSTHNLGQRGAVRSGNWDFHRNRQLDRCPHSSHSDSAQQWQGPHRRQ